MKTFFYVIMAVLFLNTWTIILNEANFLDTDMVPWDADALSDDVVNATELVDAWSYQDTGIYGDVLSGMIYLMSIFDGLILGFPNMVAHYGAPSYVANALKGIWLISWIIFVLEFMSGRNVTGD